MGEKYEKGMRKSREMGSVAIILDLEKSSGFKSAQLSSAGFYILENRGEEKGRKCKRKRKKGEKGRKGERKRGNGK